MAHTALYGGTVYEKKGGADLVGGTVYKKDHGKVLVGGTVYEVGFGKPVTVTLTGSVSNSYAEYNGTRYTFPSTFEANIGDTINFHCGDVPSSATIFLNNNQVASGVGSANHSYTVASDLNVNLQTSGSGSSVQAKMYITEIPEGHALVQIVEKGGTGYTSGCGWSKLTIDGITYTSAATVTVPIGTAIYCDVIGSGSSKPYIEVNGVRVVEGYGNKDDGYDDCSYTHIVASDITVEFYGNKGSGQIVITEQ